METLSLHFWEREGPGLSFSPAGPEEYSYLPSSLAPGRRPGEERERRGGWDHLFLSFLVLKAQKEETKFWLKEDWVELFSCNGCYND